MMKKTLAASFVLSALALAGCSTANSPEDSTVTLRLIETSDLHANVMDYDYYKDQQDITIGLARTAAIVKTARSEVINSVLVDNGDLIQGSPMGDYFAAEFGEDGVKFPKGAHPTHTVMNTMGYSVGNIGNHEFNYGLDFLKRVVDGADFPYISANVKCAVDDCFANKKKGDYLFKPYFIEDKKVIDQQGKEQIVRIGYIGFVPPQILLWDKQNLTNQEGVAIIEAIDMVTAANELVPQMKAEGADIIVAIPHSGIGSAEADKGAENATYNLSKVAGIDAIMFGHSHSVFPSQTFANQVQSHNLDLEKGLVNGIPSVMPGRWGDNMGQIDLTLKRVDGQWQVVDGISKARPIYQTVEQEGRKVKVATDEVLANEDQIAHVHGLAHDDHHATLAYVNKPIGQANINMYSFLSLVQDDPTVQIVADGQLDYVKAKIDPAYQHLPILSAAAPFKAGGRFATPSDSGSYVQVAEGQLTYKNAADLYLYPNTVVAVKATGAQVKNWLECSATQFNQIDVTSTQPQALINTKFYTFNYDVIDGVRYKIDVTQAAKYAGQDCATVQNETGRIVELSYTDAKGKTLSGAEFAQQEFIIATNNYRAFGSMFDGTGAAHVVQEFPDTNREALAAYITKASAPNAQGEYTKSVVATPDHNWGFVDIANPNVVVTFKTQKSSKAAEFIQANQYRKMTDLQQDDELGFATYRLDMTGAR